MYQKSMEGFLASPHVPKEKQIVGVWITTKYFCCQLKTNSHARTIFNFNVRRVSTRSFSLSCFAPMDVIVYGKAPLHNKA
jgi:hypothetical protein